MVTIKPYEAQHLRELIEAESNVHLKNVLKPEHLLALECNWAFSAIGEDGRVLCSAGVNELWPSRGEAWAVLHPRCKSEFLGIHNAVKRFLLVCPIRRIEAAVKVGFQEGHRWAKALGFELEAPRLKAYSPEGHDMALYARVVR
jgi:hypothetical protein